jgi:hypothetical protein
VYLFLHFAGNLERYLLHQFLQDLVLLVVIRSSISLPRM